MKKTDLGKPLEAVTFHCPGCRNTFTAAPGRADDAPELNHHPWRYFAPCRACGAEVEQAQWERALLKAWVSATGPRSEEGKAAAADNLKGHPTPEEAKRTRFNAMKHGLSARVATYFPAKPDGYPFCKGCEVDRTWCGEQPACVKQTELFMLHQAAFEQRDPKRLMGVYADLQAALYAVLQQILQTIIADGVKIVSPQYYVSKEGDKGSEMILAQYTDTNGELKTIYDIEAHPLFKPLGELLSRAGLSLADMGMTTKVIEHQDEDPGQLEHERGAGKESAAAFQTRALEVLAGLAHKMDRAGAAKDTDPVLLEYNQENGTAVPVPSE